MVDLAGATGTLGVLARLAHAHGAHGRADHADVHSEPPADHELVLLSRVHRLGLRAAWPDPGSDLPQRHWLVRGRRARLCDFARRAFSWNRRRYARNAPGGA